MTISCSSDYSLFLAPQAVTFIKLKYNPGQLDFFMNIEHLEYDATTVQQYLLD